MEKSDEQLMAGVKDDRLDNVRVLFDRYQIRIFNYFLKSIQCRDDSNDLTQTVFIRLINYRKSYRVGSNFEIWLFQIARNLLKDHFRKMKVHHDRFDSVDLLPDRPVEEEDIQENERKLYRAMDQLPGDKRELLVLSKFQGMKYEQIAAMRETSVSAIKVMVHRTIKELREIYFHQLND